MKSKRTLGRGGLCMVAAALAGSMLVPASASATPTEPAGPTAPAQGGGYDGHLEEANAWALEALNLPAAWETTRGEGVTVAVLDSGMSNHPFFEDKDVLPGYSILGEEEDAWYDISGDSPVAPHVPDGEMLPNGEPLEDKRGHGTAVTAMVLQAAPEATILPVRIFTGADEFAGGDFGDAEAVRWAVDNGADVIVTAYGMPGEASEDLHMALQYALDNDVIYLAAAGNDAEEITTGYFPAYMPGVVTVSGLGDDGEAWVDTSTGPEVDVAGPAAYSLVRPVPQSHPHMFEDTEPGDDNEEDVAPGSLYEESGGTSLAVGWIGGVVGLIRAAHADLDANAVIQRLIQTAADQGDPGHDPVFGYGVADAGAAVGDAAVDPVDANPLGYPLGVAGASGQTADGGPAPGTGATADGAAADDEENGSHAVAFAAVILAAVVLAGGASFLLQRRAATSSPRHGGQGAAAGQAPTVSTSVAVALVVALVAATGTYVGATAAIGKTESSSEAEAASDGGGSGEDIAAEVGQTAADGNAIATAAQAWQDAFTAGDLEGFRALTCANPWYRVAINLNRLENPEAIRPGFAILDEANIDQDGDFQAESYRLARASDTRAWVDVGAFDLDPNSVADYQFALVREDGDWKVCDFWFTSSSTYSGHPELEARFPRDDGIPALTSTGRTER